MGTEDRSSDNPVLFFMPSLSAVLVSEEDKKGEPLTKEEVLAIRDRAVCITMEAEDAEAMHESRGYRDIDPENCWYDWQMLRREMGRKPDLDPGVRFGQIRTSDPAYQKTIEDTQRTLDRFLQLMSTADSSVLASVKARIAAGEDEAVMWLTVVAAGESSFSAELFEVPDSLPACRVGDRFTIAREAVLDWMINDNGTIHGGYSLRYQRERMTAGERIEFDRHIGARAYVESSVR